jgi:GT2 family glycosyltransferase
MRVAFSEAMAGNFRYYLWLNDDLVLSPEGLQTLLSTHLRVTNQTGRPAIIVGCLSDDQGQEMTYGGWVRTMHGLKFGLSKIFPQSTPVRCDSMNGNCVLVPNDVVAIVGNLRPEFTHSMGDLDYGLRASKLGCQVWEAPGFVGVSSANDGRGLWCDRSRGIVERWRQLLGPKGLPIAEWHEFTKRHAGRLWFLYWINPYLKFWTVGLGRVFLDAVNPTQPRT